MIGLNKFLRGCLREGVDFKRMRFVRNEYHPQWANYFPAGVPVQFKLRNGHMFRTSGSNDAGWNCEKDEADCEVLGISLSFRKLTVTLGKGVRG